MTLLIELATSDAMELAKYLEFLKEVDKLKEVERKTLTHNGDRPENSAEHSWHLALAVMTFRHLVETENFDLSRALQMALVHDLVEIDAGDVFLYGDQSQKASREQAAADRLFGLLPENSSSNWMKLWQEFEDQSSYEARFVAALDRFLPLYSNYLNAGHSWREHGITYDQIIQKSSKVIAAGSEKLWQMAHQMLLESIERGHLTK